MKFLPDKLFYSTYQLSCAVVLACVLSLLPMPVMAQTDILKELTAQRQVLTHELEQYQKTVDILQPDGAPPEQSSNPAVKKLGQEMISIRQRLIVIIEQELTLLQEQITTAKATTTKISTPVTPETPSITATTATTAAPQPGAEAGTTQALESEAPRTHGADRRLARESETVERLRALLSGYYAELHELADTLPTAEELSQREAALKDARKQVRTPFSASKVQLDGAEGSTALSEITQRLMDPSLPESRRDIAVICSIRTHLVGALVSSESRSLKPVGKNHFVAKIRLQPGATTLSIVGHHWQVLIPENHNAGDYLITLYQPPGGDLEFHVFAIDDLLAEEQPHTPAWLPDKLKISPWTK